MKNSHIAHRDKTVSLRVVNAPLSTFQHFLRRLTYVGGNSRLLFLPRLHAEQLIDIQEFSFLNGTPAFSIIKSMIAGKSVKLCALVDSRLESNNKMSQKVKRLERVDRFLNEERGSNDLHIGWPFVQGKFSDGTLVRCPLLFFPVVLVPQQGQWVLKLREDTGITFNKTFLLAYAQSNKLKSEEDLLEHSFDDYDSDSTVFRTQLYQLLKDKLEVNFNTDLFTDELKAFEEFKKADFEKQHQQGTLKLQQQAVLGIFPQAGSQLVPDYLALMENDPTLQMESFFEERTQSNTSTLSLKEENIFTPLETDEWQEHAIKQAKIGRSLVVQGPPGTGKSQLIANLISDAIATGKRVLVVCQKRVALDVVYERLSKLGLKNFIGLVHDFRNDRKDIYAAIASQVEAIDDFKKQNRGIDMIQMERNFMLTSRSIDTIVEELEDYRNALYHEGECGLSAKELYLTSDQEQPSVNLKQEYSFFDFKTLPAFTQLVKRYARYAVRLDSETHPWCNRVSFARLDFTEVKRRGEVIDSILRTQRELALKTQEWLGYPLQLEDGEMLQAHTDLVQELISLLAKERVYSFLSTMSQEKEEETSVLWFDNLRLLCMNCFGGEGIESTLPADQLGKFQHLLQKRMEARKRSFIRLLQWEWFSEDKFWLKRVLVANGLEYTRRDLQRLESRLDNRLNFEHHLTSIRKKLWLTDAPDSLEPAPWALWFDDQRKAIKGKNILHSLREVNINLSRYTKADFVSMLEQLTMAVSEIPVQRMGWEQYITPYQIRLLLHDNSFKDQLIRTLKKDFEDLVAFDELKKGLSGNERSVIDKLFAEVRQWDDEKFEVLLQNSIRLEWLQHLETKYPVLRLVSSQRFEELAQTLKQEVAEKQRLTKELLLLRVRERVYEHMSYNRLNNAVTYRDLHHQVTKKKKIWPLRKLISECKNELFDIMPCWMASPESVSAIFPLEPLFDLVIFDEASQCFSERGIPAMARGKQVVVAGDSQQLQPSDLYQNRLESDDDNPDTETDSLLDLADKYLPTVHLQGHYRSKSKRLIDFSNHHFYKQRLKMLPDISDYITHERPIDYLKVKGTWENQTNKVEADEVAKQVMWWHQHYPEKEVGVITFNAPQQQLVLDKIEEVFADSNLTIPQGLMVKNIENVQGDERDVVIFSIGYAPDKKGTVHLQFGSLSLAGGENRLNVAVTRAREKVMVITSVEPTQLKTDDLKNDGPKLLKKYLEYAKAVASGTLQPYTEKPEEYASSWYLSRKLLAERVEVSTLPYADLFVSSDVPKLILTDDERYRFSLSIKSVHALVPALLEKKGWKHTRFFSRNYWYNKPVIDLEVQKLLV